MNCRVSMNSWLRITFPSRTSQINAACTSKTASGLLDRAGVTQLGHRRISAPEHPLDVEPKAVQHLPNLRHNLQEPLVSPIRARQERVMLRGVHLDIVIDVGHGRLNVTRLDCVEKPLYGRGGVWRSYRHRHPPKVHSR